MVPKGYCLKVQTFPAAPTGFGAGHRNPKSMSSIAWIPLVKSATTTCEMKRGCGSLSERSDGGGCVPPERLNEMAPQFHLNVQPTSIVLNLIHIVRLNVHPQPIDRDCVPTLWLKVQSDSRYIYYPSV